MKPYSQHDPVLDKGKAVPHPKRPTTCTKSGAVYCHAFSPRDLNAMERNGQIKVTLRNSKNRITAFKFI